MKPLFDGLDNADKPTIQHFRVGHTGRDRASSAEVSLKATDLVRVQSDHGEIWLTAEDFLTWPEIRTLENRGDLPEIEWVPTSRDDGAFWKALTVVSGWLGRTLAKYGKGKAAQFLEKQVRAGNQLFRWLPGQGWHPIVSAPQANLEKPWLLFIHGTFSSNHGSYGALWNSLSLAKLATDYAGILAFQHRTVSESPIDNLSDLTPLLPSQAKLVVVGFSRGGLVTELLGRSALVARQGREEPGLRDQDIELLRRALIAESDRKTADDQAAKLRNVVRGLADKKIQLTLQIPVGAAVYGTTLTNTKISQQLTLWINLLQGVNLEAVMTPETSFAVRLLSSVAEEVLDISDLPGLQAMHPYGALVQFLRKFPSPVTTTALAAVADESGFRRPLAALINGIFGVPNDWVVDRASMVPDASAERWVGYQDVSEPKLYHLSYMSSTRVQQLLKKTLERAISAQMQPEQLVALAYEPAKQPLVHAPQRAPRPARADAPILFLLPGIMGTELHVGADRVWLDKLQLFLAGMDSLRLNPDQARPGRPLPEYDELSDFLGQHYRLVSFGYDWRKSVFESAVLLDQRVREEMERAPGRSVSFIAHSMGGLVVRAWMGLANSAWLELSKLPESRFLMLGTPTAGSHAMTKVLTGEERVLKLLAAGAASRRSLVEICAQYPGVLDLLPEFNSRQSPPDTYFRPDIWDQFKDVHGYSVPTATALQHAIASRDRLRRLKWPSQTYYVAGRSDRTPIDAEVKENWFGRRTIDFTYTAEGDGRVPWAPGIPSGVTAWYVDVVHGDLASKRELFSGYLDILQQGKTKADAFASQPIRLGSSRGTSLRLKENGGLAEQGSLVDDRALASAALGGMPLRQRTAGVQRVPRIRVIVSCADVASAVHPIMVGHYRSDGLHSAEKVLDQLLGGALQRSLDAGIHPQEIGEWRCFDVHRGQSNDKAVIIGLGEFGGLGINQLSRSLERAICGHIESNSQRGTGRPANLSTVLIGTGLGGIGVEPAVQALLEALLRASDRCMQAGIVSILPEQLEIVELYSDRAHLAYHVLNRLLSGSARLRQAFELAPHLRHRNTGRRRAYSDADLSWAQRIRIRGKGNLDGFPERLSFELYSVLAKVNVANVRLNIRLLDDLIRSSSTHGQNAARESVALYNALLPPEFKAARPSGERLLLIVDRKSATLPWELLRSELPSSGAQRSLGAQATPLSIAGGMIRQLSLPRAPECLSRVGDNTALIIADPSLGGGQSAFWKAEFGQLRAAHEEGALVANLLGLAGFQVTGPLQAQGQITTGLFSDRVKILHIAGHGVYNYGDTQLTGLVLADGCFSPADVRQLPSVPELVFVNCCHLGKMPGTDFPKLAANLAQAFIEIGVRAVVAAGWAVNDQAALRFAEVFYQNMLEGRMFIDSVREARVAVYDAFPWDNTWGAYQCYGSDSYTLQASTSKDTSLVRARADALAGSWRHFGSYLDIRRTLIEPAIHLAMRAQSGQLAGEHVDTVIEALRQQWIGTGRAEELNRIYGGGELALTRQLPEINPTKRSTIPVSIHRALARLCDSSGRNLEAAIHAAWAWLADQYGVNTRSLTRVLVGAGKGALDLIEHHGATAKKDCIAWLKASSVYAEQVDALPRTTKRLHTLSQFHARSALALLELGEKPDVVLPRLGAAITCFEETLQRRLAAAGDRPASGSMLALWCRQFSTLSGDTSRQRAIARSEITANALVMCRLVQGWMGGEGLSDPEQRAYLNTPWLELKSPLFWRVHARWQRKLLWTLIRSSSRDKVLKKSIKAPRGSDLVESYVRALIAALNRDPGHHYIGDVRYLLRFLLAFAKRGEHEAPIALVESALRNWNAAVLASERDTTLQ
ncbi:CHAT domain-containing protein [Ahniella affigens]|nr:CHAT domain-containing protein [Ahniella affigens]